jgi:hypothetical protein
MKSFIRNQFVRAHDWNEEGDTLLEVLVALIIISLCVVALLGVLTTSVTTSAEFRNLTTVDTVLKSFADAVKYDTELAPVPTIYSNCASTYQVASEYPTSTVVNGGDTVFATDFVHIPAVPQWKVVLSQTGAPSIPITTFTGGGPTVTNGNVSATFTVQSNQAGGYIQPGPYSVQLSDGSSQDVANSPTTLTVNPSPTVLNPSSGSLTTQVTATASGFLQNTTLTVSVAGTNQVINSGALTDGNGNAVVNFTLSLPAGTTGPQSVTISDGTYTSTSTYTVGATSGGSSPTIPPPASAVAGSTVQISSISYWNNSTSVFDSSCGPNDNSGIQMVTLQATGPTGVTDSLQIVITNPSFGPPPGPAITVTSSPAVPEPGQPITFTATLTGSPSVCNTQAGTPTCYPTGALNWNFTGTTGIPPQPCPSAPPQQVVEVGTGPSSSASCTISASQVAVGTYQVAVNYSGDPAYGPANGTGSATVLPQTPTMTLTVSPANPVANEPMTFTATVSGPNGETAPTGTVGFAFNPFGGPGAPPCSAPTGLSSGGTSTCVVGATQVSPSLYSLKATYNGDNNYLTNTSNISVTPYTVSLVSVVLVNQPGNTLGKLQSGDSIQVNFSGPVSLGAICSAWSGSGTTAVADGLVSVVNGTNGNNDSMTITSATCQPTEGFGSLNLNSAGFVKGGNATFSGSTLSWDATQSRLTLTLGTLQTSPGTLQTVSGVNPTYTAGFALPGSPAITTGVF